MVEQSVPMWQCDAEKTTDEGMNRRIQSDCVRRVGGLGISLELGSGAIKLLLPPV